VPPFFIKFRIVITMKFSQLAFTLLLILALPISLLQADSYQIRQGDVLDVSVWGDDTLQKVIRVLPDGKISFPLAGQIDVAGQSSTDVAAMITANLKKYLPDPEVTVIVQSTEGNRIYILGKVNTPGSIPLQGPMTVLQALSISGGFDRFADLDEIKILRGKKTLDVHYKDLLQGENLGSNHLLQADDTILVP